MSETQKLPTSDIYSQLIVQAGSEVFAAIAASGENPQTVYMRYMFDSTSYDGETFKTWAEDHYGVPLTSAPWVAREVSLIFEQSPWVNINLPLGVTVEPVREDYFNIAA